MQTTSQQFSDLFAEAWMEDHVAAMDCHRVEELVTQIQALWNKDRDFFSGLVPGSMPRSQARLVTTSLREAEKAMSAIVRRAGESVSKGYSVAGLAELLASLVEVRRLLVMPLARMLAEKDTEGGSAENFASKLLREVHFVDGRPVITKELAATLPNPYE